MSDNTVQLLELLSSKICHDLISPIGAVYNGVEFMEDMGADAGPEVTELIAFSTRQASAKLQAYRMAFGAGGGDSSIKPEEVYNIFESMVAQDGKVKQKWDPHSDLGFEERPNGFCKALICTLLLALECMPKGGEISIQAGGENKTHITLEGEDAGMRDQFMPAMKREIDISALDPKLVHPYVTGLILSHYGFGLGVHSENTGSLTLELSKTS